MRHYEIVFLIHPDQSKQVPAMLDRYTEMVTSGNGKMHRIEDWGRRRLAYMINDVHKAHYIMINIECGLDVLQEIERNFKFNDSILRHLVIRRKQAITEESSMAKAKAREDAAEAAKESGSSGDSGKQAPAAEKTVKNEAVAEETQAAAETDAKQETQAEAAASSPESAAESVTEQAAEPETESAPEPETEEVVEPAAEQTDDDKKQEAE